MTSDDTVVFAGKTYVAVDTGEKTASCQKCAFNGPSGELTDECSVTNCGSTTVWMTPLNAITFRITK